MKNLDDKTLQTTRTNSAVFAARNPLPNLSSIPNTKKLKKKQTQPFFPTYSIQPVKSIQLSRLLEEDSGGDGTEEGDAGADLEARSSASRLGCVSAGASSLEAGVVGLGGAAVGGSGGGGQGGDAHGGVARHGCAGAGSHRGSASRGDGNNSRGGAAVCMLVSVAIQIVSRVTYLALIMGMADAEADDMADDMELGL